MCMRIPFFSVAGIASLGGVIALCAPCQVPETAAHLLGICPAHAAYRAVLPTSPASVGVSVPVQSECIFPTDDAV